MLPRITRSILLGALWLFAITLQAQKSSEAIPLERCDRLPVVKVRIGGTDMRFLVDTAATTMLNLKSFAGGRSKDVRITSWSGTAATSAREVFIPELMLGSHRLRDLKLPAIDLTPISHACRGTIDGIMGVDLLDKMGVTIDLKHEVASLGVDEVDTKTLYNEMEDSMGPCMTAFNKGSDDFEKCLEPEIVLYTPSGEFKGRKQVMDYLRSRYFKYAPNLRYYNKVHDLQMFGDALWYSYDYVIDTPERHIAGHGMAMCRKHDGIWRILNMHNSLRDPEMGKLNR